MNRIIFQVLLVLLLSGCRITTTVVGQGAIISQSGNFNCTTGNSGDCVEDYQTAGSETFEAVPVPGWTFVKWTGCNYATLTTCAIAFSQNTNNDAWPITATFKPIDPPVQAATYTYNALGQRMSKTVGNVTTLFQYDLQGNLIAELDSSGQALRQHVHVNNEPIAQLTRNASGGLDVQYVHSDHLGTPTLLTNQGGKVVADFETAPFGETYVGYAEVEYNKRFPGQYRDGESGLHYNYFRDYDPSVGRYIQSDPIGLSGGINTYTYVNGNPVNYIDRLGLRGSYCQRPLGDYSGENGSGPPFLNHQFICVTTQDGQVVCNSQNNPDNDPNSPLWPSPGETSLPGRDNENNAKCEEIDDDENRCFEECVLKRWAQPRPSYAIGPLGTDCQEYSDKILKTCERQCEN